MVAFEACISARASSRDQLDCTVEIISDSETYARLHRENIESSFCTEATLEFVNSQWRFSNPCRVRSSRCVRRGSPRSRRRAQTVRSHLPLELARDSFKQVEKDSPATRRTVQPRTFPTTSLVPNDLEIQSRWHRFLRPRLFFIRSRFSLSSSSRQVPPFLFQSQHTPPFAFLCEFLQFRQFLIRTDQ